MSFIDSLREYYQYHPTERLWYPKSGRSDFDYSDGAEVEERILSILASANDVSSYSIELRNSICDWPTLYHLSPNRSNLLRPFVNDLKGEILELGAGFGAITRFIAEQGGSILAVEGSARRAQGASLRCKDLNNVHFVVDTFDSFNLPYQFDVITIIGVLEYAQKYFPKDNQEDGIRNLLIKVNSLLKANGLLIVAIENQLGLKYFCGAPEDHYGVPFLGINDAYPENNVITFGKRELEFRLKQAGFAYQKWWYAFPDYKLPVCMFSSNIDDEKIGYDFSPIIAYSSTYDPQKPRNPIFSLEQTWSVVLRNGLLSSLANSFLVMARKAEREEVYDDRVCCYYSLDRRKEFAKEVVFRINTGKGTILLDKKLVFPQEKSDPSIPLSVQLEDEDTVIGQNWQWSLVKKLNKPSWCITDITEWAQVWTAALSEYISTRFSIDTNFSIHTPLPGDLFDAVPRNLVVLPGGKTRFIDQKWKLSIEIEFGYLLFRGLFLSILEVSSVEYPLVGTPVNIFQLFKLVTQHLGFWVTPSDFARYLQMESDIQKWALGKEVNLDLETYLGFNLNIRQSALNNSEQMVQIFQQLAEREQALEGLRVELSASRERAALLEGQLAEREQALEGLRAELSASRERAGLLEGQLAEREQQNTALTLQKAALQQELDALRSRYENLQQHQQEREQILQNLNNTLLEIYSSTAWKIIQWMWRVRLWLAPRGSWREKVGRKVFFFRRKTTSSSERDEALELIRSSEYFDEEWYLTMYPDVARAGFDAAYHYLYYGGFEGRDPGPQFSSSSYLEYYPDVRSARLNPLLHYLRFGQNEGRKVFTFERNNKLSELLDVLLLQPSLPKVNSNKPIDILIPVYNGKQFLEVLLQSIRKNTTIPYRLLIANDNSPDAETCNFLRNIKNTYPEIDIIYIENEQNLGFVKTVNRLVKYVRNHFVILNTDTEVPPNWLERLIYPILSNPTKVASVTPFTNAGTICSFPRFLENNSLPEGLDVESIDKYFQYVDYQNLDIELPTAVGFCMAVNKKVYDKIGLFDEQFGKGYGEENDWCMRASQLGYKNAIAPNLFVYHKHGGSFSSEEKQRLINYAEKILESKHPDYFPKVRRFIQIDPLQSVRKAVELKILCSKYPAKLIIDHDLGGGANIFTKMIKDEEDVIFRFTFQPHNSTYRLEIDGTKIEKLTLEVAEIREIEELIELLGIREIWINELVSYPKVINFIEFLKEMKTSHPALHYVFPLHDYYSICPMYNLIDYDIKFCGIPADLSYCDRCLQINPLLKKQVSYILQDYPEINISVWRQAFGEFLLLCDEIIAFSNDSKNLLLKAYPNLGSKIKLKPHVVNWVRPVEVRGEKNGLNLAVIGNVTVHKGAHLVMALATFIEYHRLNVKLYIFGEVIDATLGLDLISSVNLLGRFDRNDLPELLEKNAIEAVWISSICPETFSFTTEEALQMGLPVTVFRLGAPAERVQRYDRGIILEEERPDLILKRISAALQKDIDGLETLPTPRVNVCFVCVSNNELIYINSISASSYMTAHPILKFDNRWENLPIPVRYNQALKQLRESGFRGWIFFVHNDFSILEPVERIVEGLSYNNLYGPIGARLVEGRKVTLGEIFQGHQGGLIRFGEKIDQPIQVDTLDCQCLFFHTDLLEKYPLQFDEHPALAFHQYVEEFCLAAKKLYNIHTFAVQMKCKHLSWGKRGRDLDLAIEYINRKYLPLEWAGTCTHLESI